MVLQDKDTSQFFFLINILYDTFLNKYDNNAGKGITVPSGTRKLFSPHGLLGNTTNYDKMYSKYLYVDKKILAHKVILIFAIATQKKMLKNIYAVFIFVINIKDGAKKFLSMAQYHLRTKGHFLHFPLDNQWMDVPGVVERIFLSTEYTQWHNGKKNLVWNREKGHKDEEILCYDLHLHKPQGEKTAPA